LIVIVIVSSEIYRVLLADWIS